MTIEECIDIPKKEPEPTNMQEARSRSRYPAELRKEGIEGRVVLDIIVGKTGKILKQEVKHSPDYRLTREAMKTASYLTFEPGICGGEPAVMKVEMPFSYFIDRF